MRKKKMTAWYPDVGAFGRQSVNVVQTQLNHIKDRTPVQWISLSVSCPFPAIFSRSTMKRGGNGTCSETNLNST